MLDLILKAASDVGFTVESQEGQETIFTLGNAGKVHLLLTPDGNGPDEQYPNFSVESIHRAFNKYPNRKLAEAVHLLNDRLAALPTHLLWHIQCPDEHFKLERVYQSPKQATRITLNIFNQTY